MNWKRILVAVVVIVLLAAGGYFIYNQFISPEPEESGTDAAATAAVDPIEIGLVSANGEIVPLRNARLSFESSGQVSETLVEEGTEVQEGDPIVRLDATDQEIALVQAQAALETAKAAKQTAEAGLVAAQSGAQAAEVGVSAAEVSLSLVEAEPTEAEIALQEAAVAVAESAITQASASQGVVLQGPTASQIQAAEAQLAAAEAQLLPVREALDVLRRDDSPDEDELRRAQQNYNAAAANVAAAQAALEEAQAGATSGQRTAAFGNVSAAQAQRDAAQAQLDLLLSGAREEEITAAEAGVEQAEAALQEALLAVADAESAVQQADAGILQAEAAVASAEDALQRMIMNAPFSGIVADIAVEKGEVVTSGIPVVTMGDFSAWLVETTDLREQDVVELEIGDPVEVTVDAIPGEVLNGTIREISQVATFDRNDVTYKVTIDLDNPDQLPLRWGMTVFVNVDVE